MVRVRKKNKRNGGGASPYTVVGSPAEASSGPSPSTEQSEVLGQQLLASQQSTPHYGDAQAETKPGGINAQTGYASPRQAATGSGKRKEAGARQGLVSCSGQRGGAATAEGKRSYGKSGRGQSQPGKRSAASGRREQGRNGAVGQLSVKLEPAATSAIVDSQSCLLANGARIDDTAAKTQGSASGLHLELTPANKALATNGQPPAASAVVAGSSKVQSASSSPRSPSLPTAVLGAAISAEQAIKLAASRVAGTRRRFFAVQWDEPSHDDHDVWYIARVARPVQRHGQVQAAGRGHEHDAHQSAAPTGDLPKATHEELDLPAGWCLLEFKADFVVEEAFHLSEYAKLGRLRSLKFHPANAKTALCTSAAIATKGKASGAGKSRARAGMPAENQSRAKRAKTRTDTARRGTAPTLSTRTMNATVAAANYDLAAQLSVQPSSATTEKPGGRLTLGDTDFHSSRVSIIGSHDLQTSVPDSGRMDDACHYPGQQGDLRLSLESTAGLQEDSTAAASAMWAGAPAVGRGQADLGAFSTGLHGVGVGDGGASNWLADFSGGSGNGSGSGGAVVCSTAGVSDDLVLNGRPMISLLGTEGGGPQAGNGSSSSSNAGARSNTECECVTILHAE